MADLKGLRFFDWGLESPMDPRKGRLKHNGDRLNVNSRKGSLKGPPRMFKRTFPWIWRFEKGFENPWCEKVGLNMHVQTDLSEDLALRKASKSLVRKGRLKTRTFKRTFSKDFKIVKNKCESSHTRRAMTFSL